MILFSSNYIAILAIMIFRFCFKTFKIRRYMFYDSKYVETVVIDDVLSKRVLERLGLEDGGC